MDAVFSALEENFGIAGRTIARAIVRKFYSKLNIEFIQRGDYSLLNYVAEAKARSRV